MSIGIRLLGFLAILLAVFGGAVGVGRAVGPVDTEAPAEHAMDAGHGDGSAAGHDSGSAADAHLPQGLMVSQDGYTFELTTPTASAGPRSAVAFTIVGPDGEPVTEFDVEHEKRLHLIAVRRDFSGFQHVHPEMDEHGTWTGTSPSPPASGGCSPTSRPPARRH